tara:strand:+ start:190 stop:1101 length:912 start_codon:yes stop_codon:yes gene_type:complete
MNSYFSSKKTLSLAAFLLIATFTGEFVGGLLFGSLSLLSDSFHVLGDLMSIVIALGSLMIAQRKTPTRQMAFGFHRLEVMSALFNGLLLSVISAFIFVEAWYRFTHPSAINTTGALIIALIGLVVNTVVVTLFHKRHAVDKNDVNIESAYFHIIGDLLASFAVVSGIVAIKIFNLPIIDPIIAGFVSLLILFSAGRVLYKSSAILLHKSPQDIERVRNRVLKIDGVENLMDVRLWQVCSHLTVGTAHVIVNVNKVEETDTIKQQIKSIMREEFDIRDITLECETHDMSNKHQHTFQHEHSLPD